MVTVMDIGEHCRLCLVKEQVNVPIFEDEGDIRQVFLKITACLPVKVAKQDSLPKKICNDCLYKLESCYEFWNASVNSEKQLLQWLSKTLNGGNDMMMADQTMKEEPSDGLHVDTQVFLQQQLAYQDTETYTLEDDLPLKFVQAKKPAKAKQPRQQIQQLQQVALDEDEAEEETPSKRKRRAASKRPPVIDDDDDDDDYVVPKHDDDSEEEMDDDDGAGDGDYEPGTMSEDNDLDEPDEDDLEADPDADEAGPSGVAKTTEAPNVHPFECGVCVQSYPDEVTYADHCVSAHGGRHILCGHCKRPFGDRALFLTHYARCRRTPQCRTCGKVVLDLKRHMYKHEWRRKHAAHPCDLCWRSFEKKRFLDIHLANAHKAAKLKCADCVEEFDSSRELLQHRFRMHPDTAQSVVCPKCGKDITSLKFQRAHRNRCGREFMCDICGKTLTSTESLRLHKQTHVGHKHLKCSFCDKRFIRRNELKSHTYTHTGEKPFKCDQCPMSFTQGGTLKIHMRIHTGEKPFACTMCDKAFVSRNALTTHMKTPHK